MLLSVSVMFLKSQYSFVIPAKVWGYSVSKPVVNSSHILGR